MTPPRPAPDYEAQCYAALRQSAANIAARARRDPAFWAELLAKYGPQHENPAVTGGGENGPSGENGAGADYSKPAPAGGGLGSLTVGVSEGTTQASVCGRRVRKRAQRPTTHPNPAQRRSQ